MQVVIKKCFLLNSEKKTWHRFVSSFSRKTYLYFQKMTSPNQARLL